jgi:hypothetical protein
MEAKVKTTPQAKPATALPWKTSRALRGGDVAILATSITANDGYPVIVAEAFETLRHRDEQSAQEAADNAAYIVTACNAYPRLLSERAELVAALKDIENETRDGGQWDRRETNEVARALLQRLGA